jgi:hypothetical protein
MDLNTCNRELKEAKGGVKGLKKETDTAKAELAAVRDNATRLTVNIEDLSNKI